MRALLLAGLAACSGGDPPGADDAAWGEHFGTLLQADAVDIALDRTHAFACSETEGLQVFDVSTPDSPSLLYDNLLSGTCVQVIGVGAEMYALDPTTSELLVIHAGDHLVEGIWATDGIPTHLSVNAGKRRAFLGTEADGGAYLEVLDTTSSSDLQHKAGASLPDVEIAGIANDNSAVYLLDTGGTLHIWDHDLFSEVTFQTEGVDLSVVRSIAVVGDVLLIPLGAAGIQLVDISAPNFPASLGIWAESADGAVSIQVVGSRGLVGTDRGLLLVDLGSPATPEILGDGPLGADIADRIVAADAADSLSYAVAEGAGRVEIFYTPE